MMLEWHWSLACAETGDKVSGEPRSEAEKVKEDSEWKTGRGGSDVGEVVGEVMGNLVCWYAAEGDTGLERWKIGCNG